jgi:hypothetical protein
MPSYVSFCNFPWWIPTGFTNSGIWTDELPLPLMHGQSGTLALAGAAVSSGLPNNSERSPYEARYAKDSATGPFPSHSSHPMCTIFLVVVPE